MNPCGYNTIVSLLIGVWEKSVSVTFESAKNPASSSDR